jgi:transcriptional regulator with XRE-family HTH domain
MTVDVHHRDGSHPAGPNTSSASVGSRLRAVRKQKRLSLLDVEAMTDKEFKASVLGAYERGQRRISVPRLQRLAEVYRVPLEQLLPSAPTVLESRERPRFGDDTRAVIDLAKLEESRGPERDLLRRYLHAIELERQDFNGRVLTIRREDVRAIASLFQKSPSAMFSRLSELDLLIGS